MQATENNPSTIAAWGELLLPACLLLIMLGWPFFQGTQIFEQVFEGVFLLLIVVAAAASSPRRITFIPVVAFGSIAFVLDTVSSDALPVIERLGTVFDLLFSLALALVLAERIFGTAGDVSWRVVANALSVYLLIGFAFAAIYNLIGLGDAPLGVDLGFAEGDPDLAAFATTYFSFVTLTTLGYGDIAPSNARIASIAVVQVLIGQFYLAVIVARLVGLVVVKSRE